LVSRLELTKWSFLLHKETASMGGSAFYEFVPYHYGPFSFGLYYDIKGLLKKGYIEEGNNKSWKITRPIVVWKSVKNLNKAVKNDVDNIMRKYAGSPIKNVIDYIYDKYPWYTVNARSGSRFSKKTGKIAVYTAGYEGTQIDGFLNFLLQNGIQRIIDVRKNPIARRYGFHKSTLNRLCDNLNIDYHHFPELGIPSSLRKNLSGDNDYQKLFSLYNKTVINDEQSSIKTVTNLINEKTSVLICSEADPAHCHRSHLAVPISENSGLDIKHLRTHV